MAFEHDLGNLSSGQWKKLHALLKGFEEAWKAENAPGMAQYLPAQDDPLRPWALQELIKSDLENRWRTGQPIYLEDYMAQHQELGSAQSLPAQLIWEEYWSRRKHGDQPELDSYQKRFPDQFEKVKLLARDTGFGGGTSDGLSHSGPDLSVLWKKDQVLPIGGGYKLIERRGSGNFGQVWEAEAPGGKLVALKILNWPVDHPAAQRERQSLGLIKLLNHPYLLDIHAIHTLENVLIVVTRLADGNLKELLEKHRAEGRKGMPANELLLYLAETAEVLDYLHNQDLQHRDIKPENLLISKGHVAVGDLGVARFMEAQRVNASILGTPPYMPPEVCQGQLHEHSDQYGLAITYIELRRGECPFRYASLKGLEPEHLAEAQKLETLTGGEREVLLRAGNPDPEKRFPSCQTFLKALEQAVGSKSTGGGYRKISRIGKGSFGEVWRAEAPGGIPVAVKVLSNTDREIIEREEESLALIKGLAHPYLVKMFAVWAEDDELNIAMELNDRNMEDRLNECLREGLPHIPLDELLDYIQHAAEALDYLHANKILHRDIKPENILLQGKFAKVGDFGVAHIIEGEQLFEATTSGTMSYMPPEAFDGNYSVHSDQYSLAATYAEMRLGRRLFSFDSIKDAMDTHKRKQADLGTIPDAEQKVIRKAMAKEPDRRYANCAAFVAALKQAASGKQDAGGAAVAEQSKKSVPEPADPRISTLVPGGKPSKPVSKPAPVKKVIRKEVPQWVPEFAPEKPKRSKVKSYVIALLILSVWVVPIAAIAAIILIPMIGSQTTTVEPVLLTVTANVEGAKIIINGAEAKKNKSGKIAVAAGKHVVKVAKKGYRSVPPEITVDVRGDAVPKPLVFILLPLKASQYSLLVGVQRPGNDLPFFRHAEADVEDLGRTLVAGGFDKDKVIVMTQKRAAQDGSLLPNKKNIQAALDNLVQKCTEQDTVIVALAGHQVQFDAGPAGNWFCPAQSQFAVQDSLLSLDEVYRALTKCKAQTKLVLLDGWQHSWDAAIAKPPAQVRRERGPEMVPNGIAVIYSCQNSSRSFDHPFDQNGSFFFFVNRGLQGEADAREPDNRVSLQELVNYLKDALTKSTAETYLLEQIPEARIAGGGIDPHVALATISEGMNSYNRGFRHLQNGLKKKRTQAIPDFANAIDAFDRAEKELKDLGFADLYYQRARVRLKIGEPDKALTDCAAALQHDPTSAAAAVLLGRIYGAQKDYKKALEKINEAIDLEPDYAWAWNARGQIYEKMGEFDLAVKDCRKAIELYPRVEDLHRLLALTHWAVPAKLNRTEAELKNMSNVVNNALKINPGWQKIQKLRRLLDLSK